MKEEHTIQEAKEFINKNKEEFNEGLLNEAVHVREKINEILLIGNIDLLNNAHRLIMYIIDKQEKELKEFAKVEGVAWATHSLTLDLKLEWVQAIRRTMWKFFRRFDKLTGLIEDTDDFYEIEEYLNDMIDKFLNTFFISYSDCKEKMLKAHKEVIERLSVPLIPLTSQVSVLPLIGTMDLTRVDNILEKTLADIARLGVGMLIVDFSGMVDINTEVVDGLMKIIKGASLMGCQTTITGLRPEVVAHIVNSDISFGSETQIKATLEQAIKDVITGV
ncbi:anti-anti-sigma factor [Priestia megaterium]|nr:anti-anti-sigma factor [Priestia megaterium]